MVKCPNCGEKAKGSFCEWCGYHLVKGGTPKKLKGAEEKAKREAEREARERAKREAEEAKEAKQAEEKARKEAEQAAKERAKREAEEAKEAKQAEEKARKEAEQVSAELYEGMVKLAIASPVDCDQMRELEEYLSQVQELRLVLVGGSVEEGIKIVVSAEKPIPLVSVLREMPPVEQVVKKGKEIQVTLKAKR